MCGFWDFFLYRRPLPAQVPPTSFIAPAHPGGSVAPDGPAAGGKIEQRGFKTGTALIFVCFPFSHIAEAVSEKPGLFRTSNNKDVCPNPESSSAIRSGGLLAAFFSQMPNPHANFFIPHCHDPLPTPPKPHTVCTCLPFFTTAPTFAKNLRENLGEKLQPVEIDARASIGGAGSRRKIRPFLLAQGPAYTGQFRFLNEAWVLRQVLRSRHFYAMPFYHGKCL